ncbi:helicase-related protein [Desulfococcaceae bacterium HSG8]|nr:helicase-related protein [Desulfococcaceae bacterium HSG8]
MNRNYKTYPWRISYRTSSVVSQGKPVNILHDFYIPVLERSVRYDRVAGYFRSSSLAAASQGFSAFFNNNGKARFIVGADLSPEDVTAILRASRNTCSEIQNTGFEGALNSELDQFDTWPEGTRNGVRLLGYLIRKKILEIRVAFRVHAQTGEALAIDSLADGYVHEKWGIFTDGHENRIYISGSLNESRAALTLNAENIDVHCDWKGESERLRADEAEKEFELIWDNQNPAFQVLTLPEAVNCRLVRIAEGIRRPLEIDGSSAAALKVAPPSPIEFLRFALIKDAPRLPGGRFAGMETAPVTPWPHQDVVARRLISTWPHSYLLCDEVGLGKTIEAGLVIRSLYLSGLVRRVLIACPASLTGQWHREMAGKTLLPFGRALGGTHPRHEFLLPYKTHKSSRSLYSPDLNIISTGLLVRPERQKDLRYAEDFDLVLLDEAHYARQISSSQGYRAEPRFNKLYKTIAEQLRPKTKCLLLSTATPMQMHPAEVFDLIRFTRRAGAFRDSPGLANTCYDILGRLVRGKPISEEEWAFLRKSVLDVEIHDPDYYKYLRETVIDGRIRSSVRRWLEHGLPPRDRELKGVQRLIFSASPLSRVMLRHTRSLLEIYREKNQLTANLAERVILPLPRITFTPQEQTCYDQLEEYCRKLSARIVSNGDKRQQASLGFYLSFLRLRFASGLFAIRQTLKRRSERIRITMNPGISSEFEDPGITEYGILLSKEELLEEGDDDAEIVENFLRNRGRKDLEWELRYLETMLDPLSDLSAISSKMSALLGILDKRRIPGTERVRQTVIFTRFYDTLTDIADRLRRIDLHMRIGTFSGQGGGVSAAVGQGTTDSRRRTTHTFRLINIDREEVKRRFLNRDIDILICTDAAAEGLNLQTADLLVNFDLPWNPMKVEQRIGRIDRIGQIHDKIYICNLCYAGSAEEIVYGRLLNRLAQAGNIVGTQQLSLLPVTRDDFRNLAEKRLSEAELEEKARREAKFAGERSASREIPPEDLYNIYLRLKSQLAVGSRQSSVVSCNEQLTADCQLPTANCRLPTADYQLPTADCQLLTAIWKTLSDSSYLHNLGCGVFPDKEKKVMTLRNIPGIPNETLLTASRKTFEYGIKGINRDIHFASYGDPVFDTLLSHISESAPACICRLEADGSEYDAPITGYAVACYDPGGYPETKLVTSYNELDSLKIRESAKLKDRELRPLEKKLEKLARAEFRHIRIADALESLNNRAAISQVILNYMIIASLMQMRQKFRIGEEYFRAEVKSIEERYKDEDFQQIPDIEKEKVQKLHGLLFDIRIPSSGDKAVINAPVFLIIAALDTVCQLANRMRKKNSDLLTAEVLKRVNRETDKLFNLLD